MGKIKKLEVTKRRLNNDLSIEKKKYACNLFLIMSSKRKMLWKEYMSRDKHQ
jgi:hypothetical protein